MMTSGEAQKAGGETFSANCAICHGVKGDGRGQRHEGMSPPPANLTLPPWSEEASATRMYHVIRDGKPGTAMPSWSTFSDRQIWEVVAYVHTLGNP
ncbi:MAG TPA: cytochrome c [Stellaceae bacterium]|nr:cytochrome c [Stellaceae bacterium]